MAESPTGPVVLVVDDDPDILVLCGLVLRAARFRVLEASDGATAIALARQANPAAIVLDFMLPDMDGLRVWNA